MAFVYALVCILGWGAWMALVRDIKSQNIEGRMLFVTLGNLIFAAIVFLATGSRLPAAALAFPSGAFWLPFLGGVLWGLGGAFGFRAIDDFGLARATSYWSPQNTVWALIWGALLFGELSGLSAKVYIELALSLLLIILGIVLISVPDTPAKDMAPSAGKKEKFRGFWDILVTGFLWGSYNIPVSASAMPPLAASLPMALGMVAVVALLALLDHKPIALNKASGYPRSLAAGALWGLANMAVLLLSVIIGRGPAYAVIQPNLAVSALIGLVIFKEQKPGSRNFWRVLAGSLVVTAGAAVFGLAK